MKMNYQGYLKSKAWEVKRTLIIERDKGRCTNCGNKGEEVHHLTYENIFNEPLEDLTLLCRKCHKVEHDKRKEFTEHAKAKMNSKTAKAIAKKRRYLQRLNNDKKRIEKEMTRVQKEVSKLIEKSLS